MKTVFADANYWSAVDCLSLKVMRDQNLTEALTHDRHFEQMRFKALLRK